MASPVLGRGRITPLDLLATPLLMQPRMLLLFLAARAHRWLMLTLLSARTPRSFAAKLPSPLGARLSRCTGLFLLRYRAAPFLLVRLLPAHFSSLLRCLWTAAQLSALSATLPSSGPPAKSLKVHSAPRPRSLKETLNRIRPSVAPSDPRGNR